MKRKKWSELEEQTLLSKYSDLLRNGTLTKLKTREKKFKPIADHLNAVHHLHDSATFPFKWSWRDVSIKVQNMRHQYIGVKHKIRISSQSQSQSKSHQFNWNDGVNHWGNFLNYKQVFGFGVDESDDGDDEGGGDDSDGDVSEEELKRLGLGVLKLREVMVKREEKRREREFLKEKGEWKRDGFEFKRRECCCSERELELEMEMEMEERELRWGKKEVEKRVRLEKELEEEKRRRKKVEEKMEEEEMEWRERMVAMQIEHEKQMMQMHAEACHNQMQVLGVMARILCQFFGSGNDGLAGAGLGTLPPQVLHHGGGLGSVKPDASSPSEFM
ncbi:unnamed protein product [Lathyrus oleraceus]|uniref:Uncharacterized protein n=1 Tax=Pisum sativum TaxID=3888 RepID=A0A9D5B3V3_PEA|nr:uncharacterized protein LOC127118299 isoform X2 [Pisum sativum]KAI5434482.1 hypothetical protein KIW84_021348 [Pisum sativum]